MSTMKAAVFVEPGRIELVSKPIPSVGPNDALIRITTTTICGTDVHILKGEYPVAKGLTVGVMPEGFGTGAALPAEELVKLSAETDQVVKDALGGFEKAGAKVREMSVPMHALGAAIYTPIFVEGICKQMIDGNGFSVGHKGYYPVEAMTAYGRARKAEGDNYSDLCKLIALMGEYMFDRYQGRYYAKAQNLMLKLAAQLDAALNEVDVLVMPTMAPIGRALKLTQPSFADEYLDSYVLETFNYHVNTCPTDSTGHPAITVPCGRHDGMPVGMMMIGRKFDEATLLRIAHAFEQTGTYK